MSNPIDPGFKWQQAFDLPSGFLQAGDGLRAEFRQTRENRTVLAEIVTPEGIVIEGNRVFFYLTAEQTANMQPSEVVTNLVLQRGGEEQPIGVLIRIPVFRFPTRP